MPRSSAKTMVLIGRVLVLLALLALIGAWITEWTGEDLLGLSQEHLFNDAISLALLGVAAMLDAQWHDRGI